MNSAKALLLGVAVAFGACLDQESDVELEGVPAQGKQDAATTLFALF